MMGVSGNGVCPSTIIYHQNSEFNEENDDWILGALFSDKPISSCGETLQQFHKHQLFDD
jgi:hypothetical protein